MSNWNRAKLNIVYLLTCLALAIALSWLAGCAAPVPGPDAGATDAGPGNECAAFQYYCEDQATTIGRVGQLAGTTCRVTPAGPATATERLALEDYRRTWGGQSMCQQAIDQSINRQVY